MCTELTQHLFTLRCVTVCPEFVGQGSGLFGDVCISERFVWLKGSIESPFTVKKLKANLLDGIGLSWCTFYELMFVKDWTKLKTV